jgi:hypothetical protein
VLPKHKLELCSQLFHAPTSVATACCAAGSHRVLDASKACHGKVAQPPSRFRCCVSLSASMSWQTHVYSYAFSLAHSELSWRGLKSSLHLHVAQMHCGITTALDLPMSTNVLHLYRLYRNGVSVQQALSQGLGKPLGGPTRLCSAPWHHSSLHSECT